MLKSQQSSNKTKLINIILNIHYDKHNPKYWILYSTCYFNSNSENSREFFCRVKGAEAGTASVKLVNYIAILVIYYA